MKIPKQLLEKCGIDTSKRLDEKRDHTKAIKKFADVDLIVDWANNLDKNLALWLADKLVKIIKETIPRRFKIGLEEINKFLKGKKNFKLHELTATTLSVFGDDFIKIVDYVNSPLHGHGNKPNINNLSFGEAVEKAEEFFKKQKAFEDKTIENEDGTIIMTFDDGYYWIDLETTYSEEESEAMGHCGKIQEGTLISLRRNKIPHVTVGYNEDNRFTSQIKGRGNIKPAAKYHKYIVDLIIKMGMEGHKTEYDRDSDFSPEDLSKELYAKLEEENPTYIENSNVPPIEQLRNDYIDDVVENISEYISDDALIYDLNYKEILDDIIQKKYDIINNNIIEHINRDIENTQEYMMAVISCDDMWHMNIECYDQKDIEDYIIKIKDADKLKEIMDVTKTLHGFMMAEAEAEVEDYTTIHHIIDYQFDGDTQEFLAQYFDTEGWAQEYVDTLEDAEVFARFGY